MEESLVLILGARFKRRIYIFEKRDYMKETLEGMVEGSLKGRLGYIIDSAVLIQFEGRLV